MPCKHSRASTAPATSEQRPASLTPFLLPSDVAAWTALLGTCFSTKLSGSVSSPVRPRIWKPRRGRRQPLRPRVPSLLLRFQRIHPREPVLLRNADLLRRNAIYAGSPSASATGIVRLR